MIGPNNFCVNDVKYRCIWGSRTSWDELDKSQKERKGKIVFMEIIEERGEGSRYAWLQDDDGSINYLISIGKQEAETCTTNQSLTS